MGASLVYLDKPNKDIEIQEGSNKVLNFAAGSMQGWRLNMVNLYKSNKRIGGLPHSRVEIPTEGRLICFWRV